MVSRLNMVLDLDAPEETLSADSTRAEQFAGLRRATLAAKQRVLPLIEALRPLDPDMQILVQDSLFPVLIVRGSPDVIAQLARIPGVRQMTLERYAELH